MIARALYDFDLDLGFGKRRIVKKGESITISDSDFEQYYNVYDPPLFIFTKDEDVKKEEQKGKVAKS